MEVASDIMLFVGLAWAEEPENRHYVVVVHLFARIIEFAGRSKVNMETALDSNCYCVNPLGKYCQCA